MKENTMLIKGKYTSAITMIDNIEEECISQITEICNQEFMKDVKIRIMPDTHFGKGICIGFTALTSDKIPPNFIGVDISCSVSAYKLDTKEIDFNKLDEVIRKNVPSGNSIRSNVSRSVSAAFKDEIYEVCKEINDVRGYERHIKSLGTLGGGNHFIEVNKDKDDNIWLVIHTGSRNFGHKICGYHQDIAIKSIENDYKAEKQHLIDTLTPQEISKALSDLKATRPIGHVSYLTGEALQLYVKHMKVAQQFAILNHKIIADEIVSNLGVNIVERIMTNHNYIEFLDNGEMMIRKGSVSAKKDEMLIIPLNMRDGSLICKGKGNDDWNQSAPHGAGRILSRSKAKAELSMDEFKNEMDNVWTSCVSENTLDESPMAYKDMNIIIDSVGDTVEIIDRIIPLYNYKAN